MTDPKSDNYAIPRLHKIKRDGLAQTHAARAENGVTPPHVIPGAPGPEVIFNSAPAGVTFKAFVLDRYEQAIREGIVYRPRRDQVLAIEGLLSASPEFFRPDNPGKAGAYTPKSVELLRVRGLKFLQDQYGDRLIRVELQLDEVTPHIQFAFFPIDENGRWSAKNCTTRGILSALWTQWAKVMADVGLRRGIAGSQAKHEPIKSYYAAISRFDADSVKVAQTISIPPPKLPVPSRTSLLHPSEYISGVNEQLSNWARKETRRILKLIEPLIADAADAALARRRSRQMRRTAEQQAGKIVTMEESLEKRTQQLRRLEPVSVAAVAEKLGYGNSLDLTPHQNALAFLVQFEGLDETGALGWLAAEFGPEAAAATAADLVRANTLADAKDLERPQIRTVDELNVLLRKQLSALDADEFRMLIAPRGEEPAKFTELLVPRTKRKSWTLDEVVSAVIELKSRAADHEVRFLPISRQYAYLSVEGLKSPDAVAGIGLFPCSVVQVGPERYEATLRVSKPLDKAAAKKADSALGTLDAARAKEVSNQTPLRLVGLRTDDVQAISAVELIHAEDVDFLARILHSKGNLRTPMY